MSKNEFLYPHHIVFEKGQVASEDLGENITREGKKIIFHTGVSSLHVIFNLEEDMNFTYVVEDQAKVNLIETRVLKDGVKLERHFEVGESADVSVFNENNSVNKKEIGFLDTGNVGSYSTFNMGYAELSDGSLKASYDFKLTGVEANMKLRMAALSKDEEKKHYTVSIEHHAKHTLGIMDNYGVAKDKGSMTIDGIGSIKKGMSKSQSHQTNKIMVFDDGCHASANPYLYIDDYDVAASHAAGVGKMDENHLYYLQSRGLTKRQAMQLITYGYLRPVIDVVDNEMIKERFEKVLGKVGA